MIKIIFEDNHLLVVEKPPNILSQGDETGDEDLLTILKKDLKERYNKPGNVYLGLVHRLDRPVGGVMVFAKTSKAASRLSEQIRTGYFHKTYYAVLNGIPSRSPGLLVHYLEKDEKRNIVRVVPENSGNGKRASLSYEVLETRADMNISLVKIDLHTGRPHQIRVQFAATGTPLVGDRKYGAVSPGEQKQGGKSGSAQLALWSARIECIHPTTREQVAFDSSPPDEYPWNSFRFFKCPDGPDALNCR